MNLSDAFAQIGPELDVDPALLADYAALDSIGGFHHDESLRQWTVGSIFAVEGQFVYALIRALKPRRVLEIGVGNGCTTTHILSAIQANGKGVLVSLDPHPYNWQAVPEELRKNWLYIPEYAEVWLREHPGEHFDLAIEDGPHDYITTRDILAEARKTGASFIMSHDAAHRDVGGDIQHALHDALGEYRLLTIDPSDCGWGYWLKEWQHA